MNTPWTLIIENPVRFQAITSQILGKPTKHQTPLLEEWERVSYQLLFLNFLQILLNRNRLFGFVIKNFRHLISNSAITFNNTPLPIIEASSEDPNRKIKQPKNRSHTQNPKMKIRDNSDGDALEQTGAIPRN